MTMMSVAQGDSTNVLGSKNSWIIGDNHPAIFLGNPYKGYINPYEKKVHRPSLPQENHGSFLAPASGGGSWSTPAHESYGCFQK